MLLKELQAVEARLKERLDHNVHSITNDVEIKVMRRERSNADADLRIFKLEMKIDKLESMLEKLELKLDRLASEPLKLFERSLKHQ
jgi:hypothetical protein